MKGKQTDVTQAVFRDILLCLQCLHYKTKLEKQFRRKQAKNRWIIFFLCIQMYTPYKRSLKLVSPLLPRLCGRQKRMTPNSNYVKRRHTLRLFYKRRIYKKSLPKLYYHSFCFKLLCSCYVLCWSLIFLDKEYNNQVCRETNRIYHVYH